MVDIIDEELMLQTQRGNVHAFELLFERYRSRVFGFIFRMLNGNREEAEDLMQDVFIKLFKAKEMYEPRAKFSTWLFAIVRNHCLNFLRSRAYNQAQRTVCLQPGEMSDVALAVPGTAPEMSGASETSERLEKAINSLPAMYKDVFLLRALEGFSHDETGIILGLNAATVRTHFRRARLMLVEMMDGQAVENPANGGTKQ